MLTTLQEVKGNSNEALSYQNHGYIKRDCGSLNFVKKKGVRVRGLVHFGRRE